MATFFLKRQYPPDIVELAQARAASTSRTTALQPREQVDTQDRPVLAITYHPHNIQIKNILLRNFHLLQDDDDLGEIFTSPPLVAYKRDCNISRFLVRSKFKENCEPPPSPGTHSCGRPRCKTCPFVSSDTTFECPGGFQVTSSFTCRTTDLVYMVTCALCSKIYIGETYRSLDDRFREHYRSAALGYNNPVGRHFSTPPHNPDEHLRIAALWKNGRDRQYRKFMEAALINRFDCREPAGLNIRP
jgi:hypothetical protein